MPASDSNFAAPNGCPKLIVTLDNTIRSTAHGAALVGREAGLFFVGNQDSPTLLESGARRTRFVGIEFRPQGAYPVFGMPMIETTNRRFSADEGFAKWGRDVLEAVGNEAEISEKIDCLQGHLASSLRQGHRRSAAVDFCVNALQGTHGIVSIRELERQTGYSRRYLELLFMNHVGLPPKVLAGIFRFQKFYRKWATNCSFDELKEDLYEYHCDQSHFTKEFRKMTGSRRNSSLSMWEMSLAGASPFVRLLILTRPLTPESRTIDLIISRRPTSDHLLNWVEIPVSNMRRAVSFYGELLDMELHEMRLGPNDYAIFPCTSSQNSGALVKGGGYTPSDEGVVVYLN